MPIIGIDLGTTNSLVAVMTQDGPVVIPNSLGEYLTPSIVSVTEDGEILTGKIASERRFTAPLNTASVFKRNMGAKKEYKLGGRTFLPEELSSLIIRKLREDAEVWLGEPVTEAVISCPAYFGEAQRRATKAAGELAGLKVERIVSEPTAAAIAYGLHERGAESKFLVFDLGGGTFDISILECTDNIMEVRSVAGDNYLGGEDFTKTLTELFLTRFGLTDERLEPFERISLYAAAETAKRTFSKEHSFKIEVTIDGRPFSAAISAAEFEESAEPLLARLREPIKRALSDASLRTSDIESVILVGGATKMQLIRSFIGKSLGLFPSSVIDSDQTVALGTAVQAAMKERNEYVREMLLTDVCSHTLGIETSQRQASGLLRTGVFSPIIERNTAIPVSRSEKFYTLQDDQEKVGVCIYQGESRNTKDNVFLEKLEISVPSRPAGEEALDVRFTYDINGILEVEVTAESTGERASVLIEKNPGAMTEEEITESLEALKQLKIHPRDKDEYRFLLEKGERLFMEQKGDARQYITEVLASFEEKLDRQDPEEIEEAAKRVKEIFEELEDYDGPY